MGTKTVRPEVRLEEALVGVVPQLAAVLLRDSSGFQALTVRWRGPSDVLCVLRRETPEEGPQVCFGGGYDPAGALVALNAAVTGGRWKEDRPWGGP
jgi:hypothetical protein